MRMQKYLKVCSALVACIGIMLSEPMTAHATHSIIHQEWDWKYTGSGMVASWESKSNAKTPDSCSIYLYYSVPENEIRPDDTRFLDNYDHIVCGVITDNPSYDFTKELPKSGEYLFDFNKMQPSNKQVPIAQADYHLPVNIDIGKDVKNGWEKLSHLSSTSDPVHAIIAPYQDGWRKENDKWYYVTDETGKSRYCNCWLWIDGNHDGLAECYYFDKFGYLVVNVPAEWEQKTNCAYNHNQFFNATNENGAWYYDYADAVDNIFPDVAETRGIYYDVNDANVYKMRIN